MSGTGTHPRITAVRPLSAIAGGRLTIEASDLPGGTMLPDVSLGGTPVRVVHATSRQVSVLVPSELEGGQTPVRVGGTRGETAFVQIGTPVATGIHQVDNPVVDDEGTLYLTYSGPRGEEAPVSVFRVRRDGFREPFVTGLTNPTSMAFSPQGQLHVSSRYAGAVYRVHDDGSFETVASDLGVACGLAFSPDGVLYVGDRSGTIFRVGPAGQATPFASLPASVAAFHLAWGPDDALYLTAPTLATYDRVYRIDRTGAVEAICSCFGRPQGLAFDRHGVLHVVEALAGVSGVYRLEQTGATVQVLSAASLVGVAFDQSDGSLVVASSDTVYRVTT